MKKGIKIKSIIIYALIFCCIIIFQGNAFAAQNFTLKYDGKTVKYSGITYKINIDGKEVKTDLPAFILNQATVIPLRAVFEQLSGRVVWNGKTQVMDIEYNGINYQFKNNDRNIKINGKAVKLGATVKKVNERLVASIDLLDKIEGLGLKIDTKTKTIFILSTSTINELITETVGEKDIITFKAANLKYVEANRLTNPNRIVVDFKNVKVSDKLIKGVETKLSRVKNIKVTATGTNTARAVLELDDFDNFSVETVGTGYKIIVEKPVNAQLSYVNSYDRVYFSLKGIKLANVNSTITNYYKEVYDLNKYTIVLPTTSSISLAEDQFNIDDQLIDKVEIHKDELTMEANIVFYTKKEVKFYITYNDKLKQSEINVLMPAKAGETLVVIDAGHGGLDPGATKGSAYEKDINLAVALKLEKLLKEKGIKTYMLRQDDTFVGLYDRPYIANLLNATLFISIHNNSIDNSKISGTETLYFPEAEGSTAFTGEKFAALIQDLLIKKLKTVNRKTVERPLLVVLKYTKMPSALVELGFLTNPTELINLQKDSFQQSAAEALCEAIVLSLQKIDNSAEVNTLQR